MTSKITTFELPVESNGHEFGSVKTLNGIGYGGEFPLTAMLDTACFFCDGGKEVHVTETSVIPIEPCPLPEGITTEIILRVPSGKIIVSDNLGPVYDAFDHERVKFASYNSAKGVAQVIEAFAEQGCAFGYVGNSCPRLYPDGEGRYIIASPGYDEETDEYTSPGIEMAWICTDLWAYSIADYEDWLRKGGNARPYDTIVEIPAGVYKFTHHTGKRGFNAYAEGIVVYANIEKIEEI